MENKTNTNKILSISEMIYNNKIVYKTNTNKIDKDIKNDLKNTILDVLNTQNEHKKQNVNGVHYDMYISEQNYNKIIALTQNIIDFHDYKMTYNDIKNAIKSAYHNKMSTLEKYVKCEQTTISIADFLKSMQASIYKKVEHAKRQSYLQELENKRKAKQKTKLDKDLKKSRAKNNKRASKKQNASK